MNHVTHRANSILQKPSSIQACIEPRLAFGHELTRAPIRARIGVYKYILYRFTNDFT
jgi:hypothetical protein